MPQIGLGLWLGGTAAQGGGTPTPTYDPDAITAFNAMSVQPDASRKQLYSDLIAGLKADGIWTLLDWLVILAAHHSQAGLLNLRNPAKAMSAVNSPTFTIDRGYQGDGATSYLTFGEALYQAGTSNAQQNSNSAGAWVNLQGAGTATAPELGGLSGTRLATTPRGSAGVDTYSNFSATDNTRASNGSRLGHRMLVRTNSAEFISYLNGADPWTHTQTSATPGVAEATLLRNGVVYSADRIAETFSAGAVGNAQRAALHNRINTFLTAIGGQ